MATTHHIQTAAKEGAPRERERQRTHHHGDDGDDGESGNQAVRGERGGAG